MEYKQADSPSPAGVPSWGQSEVVLRRAEHQAGIPGGATQAPEKVHGVLTILANFYLRHAESFPF